MPSIKDVLTVTIPISVATLCQVVAGIYADQFPFSKSGINTGNESQEENYRRNNFCSILAECAVSSQFYGGTQPAFLARFCTLAYGLKHGRPNDGGIDIRPSLHEGLRIDVKCRRNRADSAQKDLDLHLVIRTHELRDPDHIFVLAVCDTPANDFWAERAWNVRIVGWCYQKQLKDAEGHFPFGNFYISARELKPIKDLDFRTTVVVL